MSPHHPKIRRLLDLFSEKKYDEIIDSFPISRPILFQYNLTQDKNRVLGFKKAIECIVEEGDIVIELGAGYGLFSKFAQANAKKVYTIESQEEVAMYGKTFCKHYPKIEYIEGDFRKSFLPQADVIICEMSDTCFITESQIQTMNHACKRLLKEDGKTIPFGAKTTVQLVNQDYRIPDDTYELRLPHYEAYGSPISKPISLEAEYQSLCFSEPNPLQYKNSVELISEMDGIANSMKFITHMETTKGIFLEPSDWLNPPLIIPLKEDIPLKKGEIAFFDISYRAALGVKGFNPNISKTE